MSDGDISQPLMHDDDVGQWIGDDSAKDSPCCRYFVGLLCAVACIAPLECVISWIAGVGHGKILCAAAFGVPIIACCILCFPISYDGEALESSGCCCGFRLNDAEFGINNYFQRLGTFAKAASSSGFGDDGTVAKFRVKLRGWFEDQTDGDPNIGTKFGANTQMVYSWSDCKQRMTSMGDRISQQTLKRENELALVVLNNSMGKFGLGTNNIGVPIIACCILCFPISYDGEALESSGCCCGFRLNGAEFGISNYFNRLTTFAKAASSSGFSDDGKVAKFRVKLRRWFDDQTDGDPNLGIKFGGNTQMVYSWSDCKQRMTAMGSRISQQTLKRENELALVVLNNSMGKFGLGTSNKAHSIVRPYLAHLFDCAEGEGWTFQRLQSQFEDFSANIEEENELALVVLNNSMGKFGLGTNNKAHSISRPYLANMFDCAEGVGWTKEGLQTQFEDLFADLDILDHNLVTRNVFDVVAPSKSKTIVTQMVLKILHRIALDMDINDEEAKELTAMQTTDLLPMACPLRIAKTFFMTACLEQPVRQQESKWCARYKRAIQAKWPVMAFHGGRPWNEASLNVTASAFLDAMLQAGGRSVPLAIDLVMGYMLSKNKPPCLNGVDFTNETNIKALLFEAMRYHPPVTTVPLWTRDTPDSEEWIHECICLDRALADAEVFPQPDVFDISRPNNEECSMAWADPALVNNDKAHPDSHACPGQQLSINMVIAFVKAYQAAGQWDYDDNINFNYYGTSKGFKCKKSSSP
eukprot:CAMPEP_0172933100 /NCGR_PEP_ID=MMETSP1075-20121228/220336_1 /TAXON_ID=2916 /ORGANISM="Ceratium fusus, Strain PA161109" /LENGTH=752 /DNA_ID=CAMNT_0013794437 /DNA_START=38 /DNA_END=2297 /DNA_ORIENTATION=-